MICLYLVLLFACPMLLAGTARAQEDSQKPMDGEKGVGGPSEYLVAYAAIDPC